MEQKFKKKNLKKIKKDQIEMRKFVKDIHLKLRQKKPQAERSVMSLYQTIIK
jgi:hypothetical protein